MLSSMLTYLISCCLKRRSSNLLPSKSFRELCFFVMMEKFGDNNLGEICRKCFIFIDYFEINSIRNPTFTGNNLPDGRRGLSSNLPDLFMEKRNHFSR